MIVELFGYEVETAKQVQRKYYDAAMTDWNYGAAEWAELIKDEPYPVPKPVEPQVKLLEDLTGKDDKARAAVIDRYKDEAPGKTQGAIFQELAGQRQWNACTITDLHGNTTARAIRSDCLLYAQTIEMKVYAKAMVLWAETTRNAGEDAAGKRPTKPVLKKIKDGMMSAAEAQEPVNKANSEIAEARKKSGIPAPDPNPPTPVKAERVEWPGLVTIYHGANWGGDETFVTAIKEAHYGASGCGIWQIDQCAKRGLHSYVFLWAHEAGTIPAQNRDNDNILCYYLGDRIKPSKWGFWAGLEAAAYAGDPQHPAVFSMAPQSWGGIEIYFPVVRGRAVEYYHYSWDAGRAPHHHYLYLELYRQHSAANGGLPVIRLLESRPEDMRKTSHTVFTSLAYGVRGFQYGGGLFDGNKRDQRGVPAQNDYGKAASKINQAIEAFSPVFRRAVNVDTFQTPPLPAGGKEAPTNYWVRPAGPDVVMGEFADRYAHYLVLANRNAFGANEAALQFAEPGLKLSKMNKVTARWEDLAPKEEKDGRSSVTVQMEQAGGELIRVVGHCMPPAISGPAQFVGKARVLISSGSQSGTVHYTLDGSEPTKKSPVYTGAVEIGATMKVRAVFVHHTGNTSSAVEATFTKVEPRKVDGKTVGPGVAYEYFEGSWTALPAFDQIKPAAQGVRPDISLKPRRRDNDYAMRFTGYLEITTAGSYTFTLGSDDGSRLIIDGETLLNIDGVHPTITQNKAVELKPGWHKVVVLYFQGSGGAELQFRYEGPGVSARPPLLWCEQ